MKTEESKRKMLAKGPLEGLTVIELAGLGPGPYAAMLLADMGARVIRVDRVGKQAADVDASADMLRRNRESVAINLRHPAGVDLVKRLVADADVLIEGFRPGITERLGLGPEDLWQVNPRLVYGRMTGWGQTGPLSKSAGHDINYIAVSGALGTIGRKGEAPVPPVNFVGDFGGGSLFLAMGVLAAVLEAGKSGRGQVVDAAIVDGSASFTGLLHSMMAIDMWRDERGVNLMDSGVPWNDTYRTSDDKWMAVGAFEQHFYDEFTRGLGIAELQVAKQRDDENTWPHLREAISAAFARRTQDEWVEVFADTDACVSPVLSLTEAKGHPHMVARDGFIEVGGIEQPAPAPRFSRTVSGTPIAPPLPGENTRQVLQEFGVKGIDRLVSERVIGEPER